MIYSEPVRTTTRRIFGILVAGLLIVAASAAALGYRLQSPSPSTAAPPTEIPPREQPQPQLPPRQAAGEAAPPTNAPPSEQPRPQLPPRRAAGEAAPPFDIPPGEQPRPQLPHRRAAGEAAPPFDIPRVERRGALGEADGLVPEGTTVFDDQSPGVANLDPALLGALRRAAADAADDGVGFSVNSGWRSPAYQNQLLREAVSLYGSQEEAAQWVATADTSPHVSGNAVDIGHPDATAWLSEHGADYGLCQIYSNEPWHYELRPAAIDHGCPPMYADPTRDPRMRP